MGVLRGNSVISEIINTLITSPEERQLFLVAFWSTICFTPVVLIYFFFKNGYFDDMKYDKFEATITTAYDYVVDKFTKKPILPTSSKIDSYPLFKKQQQYIPDSLKSVIIYDPIDMGENTIHLYAAITAKDYNL